MKKNVWKKNIFLYLFHEGNSALPDKELHTDICGFAKNERNRIAFVESDRLETCERMASFGITGSLLRVHL